MALLELKNLHVALEDGTEIVKGVDLAVDTNEIHAIMGPNGSGKSTLAYALMGHPAYEITEGQILFDGEDVTELGADERAQRGLFLAFQYPHAIPGVTVTSFLRSAINAIRKARNGGEDDPVTIPEFRTELLAAMDRLKVPRELASRYLNDGFSGGEKKRVEILQMAMLKPRIAVLDETDSGLDIDALKIVAEGVNELVGPEMGALVITHYQRILDYIKPDFVHVFVDGRIVEEGGPELAHKLEAEGYEAFGRSRRERAVMAQTETEVVEGIGSDYEYKYGFHDEPRTTSSSPAAGSRTSSSTRSPSTRTSPTGCGSSGTSRSTTSCAPAADTGAATSRDRLREHLLLHQADREAGRIPGRTCPPTSRTRGTSSASRRRRRSTWPASARSTSPRSSTTSFRRTSRTRA